MVSKLYRMYTCIVCTYKQVCNVRNLGAIGSYVYTFQKLTGIQSSTAVGRQACAGSTSCILSHPYNCKENQMVQYCETVTPMP